MQSFDSICNMMEETSDQTILLATRPGLMRNEYRNALRQMGFQVALADDDASCLELFRAALPDVLVIEPELPRGGGDVVLEAIQVELTGNQIPVFVLSAEGNRSAIYRISRFTISDFAVQPLGAQQFAERVRRLAKRHRSIAT